MQVQGSSKPAADWPRCAIERRPWTPVSTVARPLENGLTLPEHIGGEELLARMRATPASEYLVLRADGTAVGIIATRDLVQRLKGTA